MISLELVLSEYHENFSCAFRSLYAIINKGEASTMG